MIHKVVYRIVYAGAPVCTGNINSAGRTCHHALDRPKKPGLVMRVGKELDRDQMGHVPEWDDSGDNKELSVSVLIVIDNLNLIKLNKLEKLRK